jgi:hypothetical protein
MVETSYDLGDASTPPKYAMTLFTVEEFYGFWPDLEAIMDRVPHTWRQWTKESLYTSVVTGKVQVWGLGPPPLATMTFFTSVNVFPSMRVFTVIWAVGKWEPDMMPLVDATFTSYAKLNSCAEIEIRGRPGWEPQYKKIGFRRDAVVWTRPVYGSSVN